MWLLLAFASAVFAALVSVLGKKGLAGVASSVATAIRASVALVLAWVVAALAGVLPQLATLSASTLLLLLLSGLATGFSWVCYFRALSLTRVTNVIAVDRLSLLFTGLSAILLFGETANLPAKLAGLVVVVLGTFVLVSFKKTNLDSGSQKAWLPWALASMVFAVATTLLAKAGLSEVDSNLATAIRTVIVVIAAFTMVGISREGSNLRKLSPRNFGFLAASGLATGASWLCYFGAIKLGQVSVVAPIDKLSVVFAAGLAFWLLGERITRRDLVGLGLLVGGTLILLA